MTNLILLVLLAAVFIGLPMLQIRKQNQRVKAIRAFQETLQPGMLVQVTAGLQGRVVHVTESTIDLEIAPQIVTTWEKAAVLKAVDTLPEHAPEDAEG